MNKRTIRKTILTIGILGFVSCGEAPVIDENKIISEDTVAVIDVVDVNENQTDHGVPTPNEFFEVIKLNGGKLQLDLVNPLENQENYVSIEDKALNFGVYSADLAYMSCFGIGTEFLRYFKTIEGLGEELGISGAFNEEVMSRIESNEGNTDSLFSISNESYYDSYLYLEENDKGVELSLIMAGGYIESLYIVCSITDSYDPEDPMVQKIGDQKLVLESLLEFLEVYVDDQSVANAYGNLLDLNDIFENTMEFNSTDASSIENDNDILVLSGGGSFEMTKKALTKVTEKAIALRNNITNK